MGAEKAFKRASLARLRLWGIFLGSRGVLAKKKPVEPTIQPAFFRIVERDTRFELATSTLARLHSTTELVPLSGQLISRSAECVKRLARLEAN